MSGVRIWPQASRFVRIVLCALLPASAAFAQQEKSRQLLADMTKAIATLDYQGSFVYERNGQLDALRLFHAAGAQERERLVSLNGMRSEILRTGTSITCVQDGMPAQLLQARPGASLLPLIPKPGNLFPADRYAVSLAGSDRVAGYAARVVEVSARDAYRYGYRLWLDENSHLPLRSALVDGARRPLEQFMFVALDIGGKPKESDLQIDGQSSLSAEVVEMPLPAAPQWQVTDLPPGFTFAGAQRPALGPTTAEHHLYTDGIASVSLYIEPRDTNAPVIPDRAAARGAMHVYSRDAEAWRITAMGDVPSATVERIARSTRAKVMVEPPLKPS
jgi:sigma-E factor negative regulatory protein RseB